MTESLACGSQDYVECSICFKLMHTDKYSTMCHECQSNNSIILGLDKDNYGRIIDPVRRTPLKTCICGKIIGPTSHCIFLAFGMTAEGHNHRPIVVNRPETSFASLIH